MNDENMPPKISELSQESHIIKSLLLKLKEIKDQSQLEAILLRYYKEHSSDPNITSIFNGLNYDSINQKFTSSLSYDMVLSLLEIKYNCSNEPLNELNCISSEDENINEKKEDTTTIIKKPIPTSILTQENNSNEEPFNHQFVSNSIKMDKSLLYQDGVYDMNNHSMNNTLQFSNNNINLPPFSFSNKINHIDCLRVNSPFHKIIPDPIEEFKLNSLENVTINTLLNKKRVKLPIVVADNELNDNKRILRASSTAKKYKIPALNKNKKKTSCNQGRSSGFGLKEISNRVKEIIKRSGTTSYKEISDEIVSEINEKDSKDEKNIRRRIYDSLNVMKSMKLFKKDKSTKKIIWTFIDELPQTHFGISNKREDNIDQSEYIKTLNQEIRIKQTKYNTLQKEYNSLNTVIERNKTHNDSYAENNKILFPFIIIEFPNKNPKDSKVKVSMNETKTQAHFAFDSADKLYGDLDAISKIGHNITHHKN